MDALMNMIRFSNVQKKWYIPYLLNIIALLVYMFGPFGKKAIPLEFDIRLYIIPFIYLIFGSYNYRLQHATYSLARIYLLERKGLSYDSLEVYKIQTFLTPNHYIYTTVVAYCLNVISFNILLFFQGWVIALSLYVTLFILPFIVFIKYPFYLKIIRNSMEKEKKFGGLQARERYEKVLKETNNLFDAEIAFIEAGGDSSSLLANLYGIDILYLSRLLTEYISNNTNIHKLYWKRVIELTENEKGKNS